MFFFRILYILIGWEEAVFTTTQQGRLKLVLNGFEYTKSMTSKSDITLWVCAKKRRTNCKGKAKTKRVESKQMAIAYDDHLHPPDVFSIEP